MYISCKCVCLKHIICSVTRSVNREISDHCFRSLSSDAIRADQLTVFYLTVISFQMNLHIQVHESFDPKQCAQICKVRHSGCHFIRNTRMRCHMCDIYRQPIRLQDKSCINKHTKASVVVHSWLLVLLKYFRIFSSFPICLVWVTVASASCSQLKPVDPDVVVCCCGSSELRFGVVCALLCFTAQPGCKE